MTDSGKKAHIAIEWFLRISISAGFLSAVADRFGLWPASVSVWGNWEAFVAYTRSINPWFPEFLAPALAWMATILEIAFGLLLLTKFKTRLVALGSGYLILLFGISMALSTSIKAPLDYSVFSASAAAFGLWMILGAQQN